MPGDTHTILVVDDDPFHAELMEEACEQCGVPFALVSVKDGVEAMKFLRREGCYRDAQRPEFVFLDLNMPRKDGRQVLAEMKEDPDLKNIPVSVLSTSSSEEEIAQAYTLHANCYLTKPRTMDGLVQMIKDVNSFWFGAACLPS
jgi:chemotaxis family two-component system response regulator Rcp1